MGNAWAHHCLVSSHLWLRFGIRTRPGTTVNACMGKKPVVLTVHDPLAFEPWSLQFLQPAQQENIYMGQIPCDGQTGRNHKYTHAQRSQKKTKKYHSSPLRRSKGLGAHGWQPAALWRACRIPSARRVF